MPVLPAFTARLLAAFNRHLLQRRDAHMLSGLDDRMLKDIGLTRTDIFSMSGGRIRGRD